MPYQVKKIPGSNKYGIYKIIGRGAAAKFRLKSRHATRQLAMKAVALLRGGRAWLASHRQKKHPNLQVKDKQFQVKDKKKRDLPSSEDKLWGETTLINIKELKKPDMSKHTKLIMRGPFVICLSCPHKHTIPGFVLDEKGKLVKAKK